MSYAILTTSKERGYQDMAGRIQDIGGRGMYAIKNCGEGCHVLIKLGKELLAFKEPEVKPLGESRTLTEEEMDPAVINYYLLVTRVKQHCTWLASVSKICATTVPPSESDKCYSLRSTKVETIFVLQSRRAFELGRSDTTTMVTISVMLYYTPAFRSSVSDPITNIKNLVDAVNNGYANTGIPLRIKDHCIQELNMEEDANANKRLGDFENARGMKRRN
jgi:hypothetical protein